MPLSIRDSLSRIRWRVFLRPAVNCWQVVRNELGNSELEVNSVNELKWRSERGASPVIAADTAGTESDRLQGRFSHCGAERVDEDGKEEGTT